MRTTLLQHELSAAHPMDPELRFMLEKLTQKWHIPTPDFEGLFTETKQRLFAKCPKPESLDDMLLLKYVSQISGDIEDRYLLEQKSEKLIDKYQAYVKHLIYEGMNKYLNDKNGRSDQDMFLWLLENVNARLIEKIVLGKLNFKGQSLFSVYFYRIIKNALIDEIRKLPKEKYLNQDHYQNANLKDVSSAQRNASYNNFSQLISTEFQDKRERAKFIFCIKVFYRFVLSRSELVKLFPNCPNKLLTEISQAFGKNYSLMSKGDLWEKLNGFCCQISLKKQTVRTTKDWMKKHRNNILRCMLQNYPIYIPELSTGKLDRALDEYFEQIVHQRL